MKKVIVACIVLLSSALASSAQTSNGSMPQQLTPERKAQIEANAKKQSEERAVRHSKSEQNGNHLTDEQTKKIYDADLVFFYKMIIAHGDGRPLSDDEKIDIIIERLSKYKEILSQEQFTKLAKSQYNEYRIPAAKQLQ